MESGWAGLLGGISAVPGGMSAGYLLDHLLTQDSENETRSYNKYLLDYQNQFSASEAQKNRDFQAEMSNTAAQRSVADLAAAGLNPWNATETQASTPGGSSASTAAAEPAKRINFNVFGPSSKQMNQMYGQMIKTMAS